MWLTHMRRTEALTERDRSYREGDEDELFRL